MHSLHYALDQVSSDSQFYERLYSCDMEIFVDPAVLLEGTVEESFYTQHMREPRPLKD